MNLTHSQKKYLKKNLRRFPLSKIAADLDLPEEKLHEFLKANWPQEKYQKFLGKTLVGANINSLERLDLKDYFAQNWNIFAILAILVFVVYFNSLGNDFVSDDIGMIRDNPRIDSLSYFWRFPYFNLDLRSFIIFLTHKLFALQPLFYRLPNIFFHLGSTYAIFILLSLFFQPIIPLASAAIFAVHPILTESVTWISGGHYAFAAFFIYSSFLTYILAARTANPKRVYVFSVSLYIFALFSSEKSIVFPIILLFYEICFGKLRSNWKKLIPFWLGSFLWISYLVLSMKTRTTTLETAFYQEPGIDNPLIKIPIAVTSYLELIFWPNKLTLYHSELAFSQGEYLLRLGIFIFVFILAILSFKKNRQIFFWFFFFLISLAPSLTPLRISWAIAERYVYFGALGIFVILALIIQKIGEITKNQKVSVFFLSLIILGLSIRTIIRNSDWKNQDTLWLATARTSPSSPQNHNNLGDYYGRQGNLERAVLEFKTAIELKPNYGDAYHNLGNVYQEMGKNDLAIENYQKAIHYNPNLWQSYQNIAAVYFKEGKYPLAIDYMQKAITTNPQDANLHTNLGIVFFKVGDRQKATGAFKEALRLNPEDQRAKAGLIEATK